MATNAQRLNQAAIRTGNLGYSYNLGNTPAKQRQTEAMKRHYNSTIRMAGHRRAGPEIDPYDISADRQTRAFYINPQYPGLANSIGGTGFNSAPLSLEEAGKGAGLLLAGLYGGTAGAALTEVVADYRALVEREADAGRIPISQYDNFPAFNKPRKVPASVRGFLQSAWNYATSYVSNNPTMQIAGGPMLAITAN